MRVLKIAISIILSLFLSTAAYPQEKPGPTKEEPGVAQEEAVAAQEDDRLPIYKEGW
jgi:hypothetical protein